MSSYARFATGATLGVVGYFALELQGFSGVMIAPLVTLCVVAGFRAPRIRTLRCSYCGTSRRVNSKFQRTSKD